jgi:FkbM family methyltransferase
MIYFLSGAFPMNEFRSAQSTSGDDIVLDRKTGNLRTPGFKPSLHALLMKASHRALAPMGYLGVSRVHGLINTVIPLKTQTMVFEGDWRFRFPSDDYYWNRMLDNTWCYEPEIDYVLRKLADTPWTFVDLGANLGFWTSRVGCGLYGKRHSVAVEPSEHCFNYLRLNTEGLGNASSLHRKAIDEVSGRSVNLFGHRHAGTSILADWPGASNQVNGSVETVAIDDLLRAEGLSLERDPLMIKLDVEGVELQALKGASETVRGTSAWLVEDVGTGVASDAITLAFDTLGMTAWALEDSRIFRLKTLSDLVQFKGGRRSLQYKGFNFLLSASEYWLQKFNALSAD